MKQSLVTSFNVIMSGISAIISFLSFLVVKGLHLLTAYYYYVIALSFICLAFCFLFRKKKSAIYPSIFFSLLLILSIGVGSHDMTIQKKEQEKMMLSDATIAIVQQIMISKSEWLSKAIYDDDLVYFLLPSSYDTEKFILSIYDINKLPLNGDSLRYNFRTSYSKIGECTVDGAYKVIAALHSCIKNDYSIGKDIMILPDNVHDVVKARWHHSEQNWKGEREALLTADSLGNPAAAYYLALLFERGYGEYPRTHQEDADNYWRKAASNGCRSAKMHIARSIIMDSLSSTLERGIAVDYLYEVANPNTIALSSIWDEVYESNALLDYYYRSVGNGNKSYEITKRALANNNDPRLLGLHLDNCLRCGKYDEALTLVRRGKKEGNIMAYFTHAKMLTSGLGVKKDLKKAQRIVKYVLDEFDEPLAYHYLAEIYKEEGKDLKEVAYIDSLSSIDFKRQLR